MSNNLPNTLSESSPDLSNSSENVHIPVLMQEVVNFLLEKQTKNQEMTIFDGTLGGGGYSLSFLEKGCRLFACDLDNEAIENFQKKVSSLVADSNSKMANLPKDFVNLKQNNFRDYIESFEDNFFDGITLDLGFSSNQLESGGRGFSYQKREEILDLRYNTESGEAAWQKLQNKRENENLGRIIFGYSGEKFSMLIAKHILAYVEQKNPQEPITVGEIRDLVEMILPRKFHHKLNATLSRLWQALRIWTNGELTALEEFLPISVQKLKPGGRLAIVSFHSLEDKIVTQFMRKEAAWQEVDQFGNREQFYKLLTPKVVEPSEEEIEKNVRSRSGRLRVLEKV